MPDEPMAIQEAVELFIVERCQVVLGENGVEGIQLSNNFFILKTKECELCNKSFKTFAEMAYKYCVKCSPKCQICDEPCLNGTIEDLCLNCFKETL